MSLAGGEPADAAVVAARAGRGRVAGTLVLAIGLPVLVLATAVSRGSTWLFGLGIGLAVVAIGRWFREDRKQVVAGIVSDDHGFTIAHAAGGEPGTWAWTDIEKVQRRAPRELILVPRSGDPIEIPLARAADGGPSPEVVADRIVERALAAGAIEERHVLPRFLPDGNDPPAG